MSELNKKLSALSRQQGQEHGNSRSEIKPAMIKPVKQTNLKPWAALGILSLGAVMGIGGWQLWTSDDPVAEVVMAVNPVAPVEAAPAAIETQPIVKLTETEPGPEKAVENRVSPPVKQATVQTDVKPAAKTVKSPIAPSQQTQTPAIEQPPVAAKSSVAKSSATKPSIEKAVAKTTAKAVVKPVAKTEAKTASKTVPVSAVDSHEDSTVEMMDGDESLMIETVELDAGQLAQIEYKKAEKTLKQGDSRKAIGYLESAIKYQPEWITARQKLAALYYGRGENRRAIATLQQGLILDSNQPDLRLTMAKLLVNESQQQAALNVLSQLPSHTHSDYLAMRGALAQQLNQNDLALSSYQNLVKAEPYDGRWWLGLGVALERGQELDQAEDAYQQALRMGQISAETQQFIRQRLAVLASMKG
ncbi:tetratricopeptide repeat protein [Photobacterium satsumensis]|uniref:tetratricopeptide repeat protein n=1 Tax=Photobacterium satsumensis TaxID=2910239 RepID=UPI003D11A714